MTLPPGNPMIRVLVILLAFEAVVFGLAIPGMIMVSGVPPVIAAVAAGAAIAVALFACGLLRLGPIGYVLGWVTQVAGIALGILTPYQYVMGVVFALLYVVTYVLGRRLAGLSESTDRLRP